MPLLEYHDGWRIEIRQEAGGGWTFVARNPQAPAGKLAEINPTRAYWPTAAEALAYARGLIDRAPWSHNPPGDAQRHE